MLETLTEKDWRLVHLERLGLTEDPFKLSADPRYLYDYLGLGQGDFRSLF